jgi:hypothetical protein
MEVDDGFARNRVGAQRAHQEWWPGTRALRPEGGNHRYWVTLHGRSVWIFRKWISNGLLRPYHGG